MFNDDQNKIFKIKIITRNMNYYRNKGYKCNLYDIIDVNIDDLPENSSELVEVFCDYCLENGYKNIIKIRYSKFIEQLKNNEKNCCKNCRKNKTQETVLKKYGVKNVSQLENVKIKKENTCIKNNGTKHPLQNKEIKEKIKQTNLKKYGYEYPTQSDIVKEKTKQTNLKKYGHKYTLQSNDIRKKIEQTNLNKYGVKNVFQSEKIKEKIKKTNLKRYNVEYPMQSKEIQEKSKQTCIKKYGVDHNMKNEEIKNKVIKNKVIKNTLYSKYKNKTGICSKQQKHLNTILGGELNYPVDRCLLDIAFPNEMIYIEYDGSGHDLCTKLGVTNNEFKNKEIHRKKFLESKNWKLIRIISKHDYLPDNNKLVDIINEAKKYLLTTSHTWYNINIDELTIECSEFHKSIKNIDLYKI